MLKGLFQIVPFDPNIYIANIERIFLTVIVIDLTDACSENYIARSNIHTLTIKQDPRINFHIPLWFF